MKALKIGMLTMSIFVFTFFLYSCGCSCDCVKGLDCAKVSVKLISNDSLVLVKKYCQDYALYDGNKAINDSISQLAKIYPSSEYRITPKDTSYIYDKITTKDCNANPKDYHCECAK